MTAMSDRLSHPINPDPAPHEVVPMPSSVFFYENELSRERAQARKRAIKRWVRRLLGRSPLAENTELDDVPSRRRRAA
jgi:hypothetical protein